jgi:hypothetical protein
VRVKNRIHHCSFGQAARRQSCDADPWNAQKSTPRKRQNARSGSIELGDRSRPILNSPGSITPLNHSSSSFKRSKLVTPPVPVVRSPLLFVPRYRGSPCDFNRSLRPTLQFGEQITKNRITMEMVRITDEMPRVIKTPRDLIRHNRTMDDVGRHPGIID